MSIKTRTGHIPSEDTILVRGKIGSSIDTYDRVTSVSLKKGELCVNKRVPTNEEQKEFERLFSLENLHEAFCKAKKNKAHSRSVSIYESNLETKLLLIRKQVLCGEFYFGPYREFTVKDPKWRLIAASPFKDRIVHWVLYDYLLPLFFPSFIRESYGNLPGRGSSKALQKAASLIKKEEHTYILKIDFSKYFYSIHHDVLLSQIRRKVSNLLIYGLIEKLVESFKAGKSFDHLFDESSPYHTTQKKGMPIGSLSSQLFANIYLNSLDHFAKDYLGESGYIRYVDDIVVFTKNKQRAKYLLTELNHYASSRLGLQLHPKKILLQHKDKGLEFIGYRIYKYGIFPKMQPQKRIRRILNIKAESSLPAVRGFLANTNSAVLDLARVA